MLIETVWPPVCGFLGRSGAMNKSTASLSAPGGCGHAEPNNSLDASGISALLIDNLRITESSPVGSTQPVAGFEAPCEGSLLHNIR